MTKPKRSRAKPRTKPVPESPALGIGAPTGEIPAELQEVMKRSPEQLEEMKAEPPRAVTADASPAGRVSAVKRWLARVFIG
jgi:hypothetical protein